MHLLQKLRTDTVKTLQGGHIPKAIFEATKARIRKEMEILKKAGFDPDRDNEACSVFCSAEQADILFKDDKNVPNSKL